MKKKELKEIAKRMARAEQIISTSNDSEEIREAENTVMTLSMRLNSTDDMLAVDELVREILSEN